VQRRELCASMFVTRICVGDLSLGTLSFFHIRTVHLDIIKVF